MKTELLGERRNLLTAIRHKNIFAHKQLEKYGRSIVTNRILFDILWCLHILSDTGLRVPATLVNEGQFIESGKSGYFRKV